MIDFSIIRWEIAVGLLALAVLIVDLFCPKTQKQTLAFAAAASLGLMLLWCFFIGNGLPLGATRNFTANGFYLLDELAVWSKEFSLLATMISIVMSARFMKHHEEHLAEYVV